MTAATSVVAVVTFEPTDEQLTMLRQQFRATPLEVVVWDNSTTGITRKKVRQACDEAGFTLLGSGANEGTGAALNAFVRHAVACEARWVTYFDQDSRAATSFLDLIGDLDALPDDVAAVGASYDDVAVGLGGEGRGSQPWPARFVIASGTSWRVAALQLIDGADEAMFLDLVDHELCLRLRCAGLKILIDPRRRMVHAIGEDGRRITGPLAVTRHPSWRRVLMWRNSTILVRRYATRYPADCARHLVVRCAETLAGTIVYREPGWLVAAARGIARGLGDGGRRGLTASTH